MSVPEEEVYWAGELGEFRRFVEADSARDYRDWQPTKWQSLMGVSSQLVDRYGHDATALELGCGSATLLLQLAAAGWQCTGVDIAPSAIELASLAASTLGSFADFTVADFREVPGPTADLVLSIGVIEHFREDEQRALLDLHLRRARSGVLLGIPNMDSPVFRSFVEWARRNGCLYEEEHYPISVPDLAHQLGCRVALEDGCHLFLGKSDYVIDEVPDLATLYEELRGRLVAAGGEPYGAFPKLDFEATDIDVLSQVELEAGREMRHRFGFLQYFLIEKP